MTGTTGSPRCSASASVGLPSPAAGSVCGSSGAAGGGGAGGGSCGGGPGSELLPGRFALARVARDMVCMTLSSELTEASGAVRVYVAVLTALLEAPDARGKVWVKRPGVVLSLASGLFGSVSLWPCKMAMSCASVTDGPARR